MPQCYLVSYQDDALNETLHHCTKAILHSNSKVLDNSSSTIEAKTAITLMLDWWWRVILQKNSNLEHC